MKYIERDYGLIKYDRRFFNRQRIEDITNELKDDYIGTYDYPSYDVYSPAGIEVYYNIFKD
jgi:hypothetical protein